MRTMVFQVELLSDAVISASGATAGAHETLPYLPGSLFLGVCGKRYQAFERNRFEVFHSGKVRFLPAYPLDWSGKTGLPVPQCFYGDKYSDEDAEERLPFTNLALPGNTMSKHPKQLRDKFFTPEAKNLFTPKKRLLLKTAIDPSSGRVAEGQLFAYQTLQAGTLFRFEVHLDDDIPVSVEALIEKMLTSREVGLGRSRSAEFGWASIARLETPCYPRTCSVPTDGTLLFYLLSDTALVDSSTGRPTLEPAAEHFGLDQGWQLDWNRTFLSTRRYTPINRTRKRPDPERQVLCRGSVLCFEGGPRPSDLETLLKRGIGLYRQDGLGQVWIMPDFLQYPELRLRVRKPKQEDSPPSVPAPDDALVTWLVDRAAMERAEDEAYEKAQAWVADLKKYRRVGCGATAAQWGMVAERAAMANNGRQLFGELFGKTEGGDKEARLNQEQRREQLGLLGSGTRQKRWRQDRVRGKFLYDVLKQQAKELLNKDQDDLPRVLRLTAKLMQRAEIRARKGEVRS